LDTNTCLLCRGTQIEKLFSVKDHGISGEQFHLSECKSCHFRFTSDAPKEIDIAPYYEASKYISHTEDSASFVNRIYFGIRDLMLEKKYKLIRNYSSGKNFLDIGCGLAYFLNHAKSNGNEVLGIEVSEQTAQQARDKFKIQIESPQTFLRGEIKSKFDVISLWHVLEHLYNPVDYLNQIKVNMSQDAILVIAVPNHNSFDGKKYQQYWAGYDVPRHLWHFEAKTLIPWMENQGFKNIGIHALPFDAFYVSLLSEQYKGNSLAILRGFFSGMRSYFSSLRNVKTTSSIIYIFKLKNS
jgi:2-polyprenyl-3-methyl-5-hydroxy-6-metoxy-1,4-benzoquinol methylase